CQAEDGIRDFHVTGVQTCALPILNSNLTDGSVDVAIRFGDGKWSDGQATRLYNDTIFPVCSPDFAERAGPVDTLDDLVGHPLVKIGRASCRERVERWVVAGAQKRR